MRVSSWCLICFLHSGQFRKPARKQTWVSCRTDTAMRTECHARLWPLLAQLLLDACEVEGVSALESQRRRLSEPFDEADRAELLLVHIVLALRRAAFFQARQTSLRTNSSVPGTFALKPTVSPLTPPHRCPHLSVFAHASLRLPMHSCRAHVERPVTHRFCTCWLQHAIGEGGFVAGAVLDLVRAVAQ